MTIIELLLIFLVIGGVLWYIRRGNNKHKHKWIYMFTGGPDNDFNWFYCKDCMAQSVAKMANDGLIELRVYEIKKPWRTKK